MSTSREQKEAFDRGVQSRIAANVLLVSLLAILLMVFINFGVKELGMRHDLRFDLSLNKSLQLEDSTKSFVRSVDDEIVAYMVFGIDDHMKKQARKSLGDRNFDTGYIDRYYRPCLQHMVSQIDVLMGEFLQLNQRIQFRPIDAEKERDAPVTVQRRLGMGAAQLLNHVVFLNTRTGAKKAISLYSFFEVDLGGPDPTLGFSPPLISGDFIESRVLIGLRSVMDRKRVNVGVVQGHKERLMKTVVEILQNDNFKIGPVELLGEESHIPEDCDVLLVFSPARRWSNPALKELQRFVESGGRVLITQGSDSQEPFTTLLERFGLSMMPVQVGHETLNISRKGQYWLYGSELLRPSSGQPHSITESAVRDGLPIELGFCRGYELIPDFERDRITRKVLARSTAGSTAMPWRFDGKLFRQAPELVATKGDFALMVAAEVKRNESERVGRLIVVGSDDWLNDGPLRRRVEAANLDIFMNSVYWLTDTEQLITGTPRSFRGSLVNLEGGRRRSFMWLTVAIIPGLILLFGALMFVWRRR